MKTQIIENADEIILRYIPVKEWIWCGFLTLVFVIFCTWLIYSYFFKPSMLFEASTKDWFEILPVLLFIVAIGLLGIFEISLGSVFFAQMITITVNRRANYVEIFRQKFYFGKTQRFHFHQIKKFKSYREKRSYQQILEGEEKFSSTYFLSLILVNQKEIKLHIPIGEYKYDTVRFIKKLNKIIISENSNGNGLSL